MEFDFGGTDDERADGGDAEGITDDEGADGRDVDGTTDGEISDGRKEFAAMRGPELLAGRESLGVVCKYKIKRLGIRRMN